jgi:hypothetical protein
MQEFKGKHPEVPRLAVQHLQALHLGGQRDAMKQGTHAEELQVNGTGGSIGWIGW